MVTMLKEKVNTHFSFPLRLDMSQYMEKNLMGPDKLKGNNETKQKYGQNATLNQMYFPSS
jgi:ubiquitin carboxyl-terminal hydrolase 34